MGFRAAWKSDRATNYKIDQMEHNPEVSPLGQQPLSDDSLPELPETDHPKPDSPTIEHPLNTDLDSGKHKMDSDPKPERPKKKVKKALPLPSPPEETAKVNGGGEISPENTPEPNNDSYQLVVYNPNAGTESQAIITPPPVNRVLPSIGAFTVQCAACFKWRLIPTKEKYEEIRETILQDPFVCERAKEWRPEVKCEDKEDISQDGSRLWAIDKPNIAQTPKGWDRLIHIRGEGSTRFADVYYASPTGKKLRSMVEIEKYLNENPEYKAQGVTLAQFSFQIPRPLQDNYVRKRVPRPITPSDPNNTNTDNNNNSNNINAPDLSKPLEPEEVNPIAWAPPPSSAREQLPAGDPMPPVTPSSVDQVDHTPVKPVNSPVRRKIVVKPPSREKNLSQMPAFENVAPSSIPSEAQNSPPRGPPLSGDQM